MKRRIALGVMLLAICTLLLSPSVGSMVLEPALSAAEWTVRALRAHTGGEQAESAALLSAEPSGPENGADGEVFEDLSEPEETPEAYVPEVEIPDLPEDAAMADAIRYVRRNGLLSGYTGGAFRPDALLTRGQALTALRRTAALTGAEGVEESDAEWAVRAGILSGTGGDGGTRVTRGQLAAFLYRFAAYLGRNVSCSGDLSQFPDGPVVPSYARVPLSWAMEHSIFEVLVEDTLSPQVSVSRGQAAQVLTAFMAETDPEAALITRTAWQPAFRSLSRERHAELQKVVETVRSEYGAVGIQVAVVEEGRLTDAYAAGWAVKDKVPMTPGHKLRVASLSKVAVGMTAMREREDGLISLDAPIGTYWGADFRNPYYPTVPVTIRGILSHTSSIAFLDTNGLVPETVYARLQSPVGYTEQIPGSIASWLYNNYAFGVLGMTMERASGKTMDQMLQEYFFRAMGIDGAFAPANLSDPSLLASLYDHTGTVTRSAVLQRKLPSWSPGTRGMDFAGGLMISVRDLGRIAALLANDGVYEGVRLLSEESVSRMEEAAGWEPEGDFKQCYPLRWRANAYGRSELYYHTGSAYGVYNGFSYDPATGDGVVVLTTGAADTRDGSGNYAVCGAVYDAFYRAVQR